MSNDTQTLRRLARRHNTFPLHNIRSITAREAERAARLRAARLADETGNPDDEMPGYELVRAPGCYSGPTPPTVGWVWSLEAAEDISGQATHMPGGSTHYGLAMD